MKLTTQIFKGIVFLIISVLLLIGCSGDKVRLTGTITAQYDSLRVSNTILNRYYNYNIYEFRSDSIVLFAYNYITHSIDRFNLSSVQELPSIKLSHEGPQAIGDVKALAVTDVIIAVRNSLGISILYHNNSDVTTIPYRMEIMDLNFLNKKYQFNKAFSFNLYGALGLSSDGEQVVMPAYSLKYLFGQSKEKYDQSHAIGLLDLQNGGIKIILPEYPKYFTEDNYYGDLDDLQVLFVNKEILYSYRCTPDFWKLNPITETTIKSGKLPKELDRLPSPIDKYKSDDATYRLNYLANSPIYYELKFDILDKKYYRTYKGATSSNNIYDYSNNFIMRFDQNLIYESSWALNKMIIPDVFPTSVGIYALCRSQNEDYLKFVLIHTN